MSTSTADDVDRVFVALADPTRRQLLTLLGSRTTASATTLAAQLPVTRQAVVKHLAILQESDLIARRRDGREIVFTVRPERLVAAASWMTSLAATWQERLEALKRAAESGPSDRSGPDSRG
jgi:DNA-binding transcriptional ArsR family regulator